MDNLLGDFLRARRELTSPEDAGLRIDGGRRRVPGLRREEVATLAGVSVEYYTRLERGRDRTPSPQVLKSLAQVLQLDAEAAEYMTGLAGRTLPDAAAAGDEIPPTLAAFVDAITVPAVILGFYSDVLIANHAAQLLSPGLRPGINRLRWEFLDPEARRSNPDWDTTTAAAVAHLRAQAGTNTTDPRLHALIGELSVHSERFRELWARHDVHTVGGGPITLIHPLAGTLTLQAEKFFHAGPTGLQLLALHPEPGSPSARAIEALTRASHSS